MEVFIVEHFEEAWTNNRNFILPLDFETLSGVLSSDHLNVQSEYLVWQVVHDWVNFDRCNRLVHYLPKLITNCLRFGLLPSQFIDAYIFRCALFTALPNVVQQKLKDFIGSIHQSASHYSTSVYFRPRGAPSPQIDHLPDHTLVCFDSNNGLAEHYSLPEQRWKLSPVLELPLPWQSSNHHLQLLIVASKLYLICTTISRQATAEARLWSRNLAGQRLQWTEEAAMIQSRVHFSSAVFDDQKFLYVVGGFDGPANRTLASCERYDTDRNVWSPVAALAVARYGAAITTFLGGIYIAGGVNVRRRVERSVERYDPVEDRWTLAAPMTTPRFAFALATFGGRLWAIGGYGQSHQELSSVESYDSLTDSWRPELPLAGGPRSCHAATQFAGELLVVGGQRRGGTELACTVERYVPGEGWRQSGTLQMGHASPKLMVLPRAYAAPFTSAG